MLNEENEDRESGVLDTSSWPVNKIPNTHIRTLRSLRQVLRTVALAVMVSVGAGVGTHARRVSVAAVPRVVGSAEAVLDGNAHVVRLHLLLVGGVDRGAHYGGGARLGAAIRCVYIVNRC